VTGESLGLLIEEQRTNLFVRSEEFNTASWTKQSLTITANNATAPSGDTTADLLTVLGGSLVTPQCFQTATTTAALTTFSAYIKTGNHRYFQVRFGIGSVALGLGYANFDVGGSGAVGDIGAGLSSASITAVGNGWFRCVITGTTLAASGNQGVFVVSGLNAPSAQTWTPSETITGYIWGAQLEAGAFPTSYIPTVASQVTRSADAASMTGANFSSWYTGGAGTMYSESAVYAAAVKSQGVWDLLGGATSTSLRSPQSTDPRLRAFVGGTFSGFGAGPAITNNVFIKATVAWQGLSGRLQSGGTGVDVAAVANLDATQLLIGSLINSGSNSLNGTIKKLAFYPARLTNAELQGLTS
jgi:hypothetical protein